MAGSEVGSMTEALLPLLPLPSTSTGTGTLEHGQVSQPARTSWAGSVGGPLSNSAGACGLRVCPALTILNAGQSRASHPAPRSLSESAGPPERRPRNEGAYVVLRFGAGQAAPYLLCPLPVRMPRRVVVPEALTPLWREAPTSTPGGPPRGFRTGEHRLHGAGVLLGLRGEEEARGSSPGSVPPVKTAGTDR